MTTNHQNRVHPVLREWSDESLEEAYGSLVKEADRSTLMAISRGDQRDRWPTNVNRWLEDRANAELQRRGVTLPTLASLMEPLLG